MCTVCKKKKIVAFNVHAHSCNLYAYINQTSFNSPGNLVTCPGRHALLHAMQRSRACGAYTMLGTNPGQREREREKKKTLTSRCTCISKHVLHYCFHGYLLGLGAVPYIINCYVRTEVSPYFTFRKFMTQIPKQENI